jgi:hypothetical protein
MNAATIPTIEEDVKTVTEAFLAGRLVPPDVDARIAERAAEARQRIFEQHGFLDIAVPYIRQDRETGH